MNSFHEYLKGILKQILNSYQILTELNDVPNDLEIINKEFSKIKGLLQVIKNKLGEKISTKIAQKLNTKNKMLE